MAVYGRGLAAGTALIVALVTFGCGDDSDSQGSDEADDSNGAAAAVPEATPMADDDVAALAQVVDEAGPCELLDDRACGLPFPSDRFTLADDGTDTGRLVDLPEAGLVANVEGVELDVTEWNRNDGFSPGTPIMAYAPGVDLEATGAASIGDIARSVEDDSPTLLVDMDTGERLAHWVELDADEAAGDEPLLIIRPAVNLPSGARVAVGLAGLSDGEGEPVEPSLSFRAYRDHLTTDIDEVEDRRPAMEETFAALTAAGADREGLYLAWDFTVASSRNLTERMLHIRDDAFDDLGEAAPSFEVTEVEPGGHDGIARRVEGTFEVPLYLTDEGAPGSRFREGDDGLPETDGSTFEATFTCQVPEGAVEDGVGSTRMVVYGHGLLGGQSEVGGSQVGRNAAVNDMVFCATDWIGMATDDIGNVAAALSDMSNFPTMADRMQQGILNTLFLGRLMIHPEGLGTDAAFHGEEGEPLPDTSEAYYYGNSQGGIMGVAATAVATDWTQAVLGVPGMNYSTLLDRSIDYAQYEAVFTDAYPDRVDQLVMYGLMQMLWDRSEGNGYAHHLTDDPLPGTPEHQVLLHVAFGDHQVAQVTAEVMARTAGVPLHSPALEDGRHPDEAPFFGLEQVDSYPFDGSALVYWDTGTLAPPAGNITPHESAAYLDECGDVDPDDIGSEDEATIRLCADSHEDPRRAPESMAQVDAFFQPDGQVIDPCEGVPCTVEPRALLDF